MFVKQLDPSILLSLWLALIGHNSTIVSLVYFVFIDLLILNDKIFNDFDWPDHEQDECRNIRIEFSSKLG